MEREIKNIMTSMGYQENTISEIDFFMRHGGCYLTDFSFEKKTETARFYILNKNEGYEQGREAVALLLNELKECGHDKLAYYADKFYKKFDFPFSESETNSYFPGYGYAARKDGLFAIKPYIYLNESHKKLELDGELTSVSKRRYDSLKSYFSTLESKNNKYMSLLFNTSLWCLGDVYMGTTYLGTGDYAHKVYIESSERDESSEKVLLDNVRELNNHLSKRHPQLSVIMGQYLDKYIDDFAQNGLKFDTF